MKFAYFSHVWGSAGQTPHDRYRQLWRELSLADRAGFDYAFSVEHHFTPHESWMPSPALFCTAAALCTERIRVGPMGYVPALYHPLRLVEEALGLDQVLGGRLELGLAAGVSPDIFEPYGADYARRKERLDECVDLLRAAGAAEGPFDFDGPIHQLRQVELSFGSAQRPHPPLWVPTGNRHTLRRLARLGAHTSTTMIVPRAAGRAVYPHYMRWWREEGHPGRPNIGYWTMVYVDETDSSAIARVAPYLHQTITKTLRYGSGNPAHIRQRSGADSAMASSSLSTETILSRADDLQFLLDHNLIFVGSPTTVAQAIREAAEEGCFNTLLAEMNLPGMPERQLNESVQLFAQEVIPALASFEPAY